MSLKSDPDSKFGSFNSSTSRGGNSSVEDMFQGTRLDAQSHNTSNHDETGHALDEQATYNNYANQLGAGQMVPLDVVKDLIESIKSLTNKSTNNNNDNISNNKSDSEHMQKQVKGFNGDLRSWPDWKKRMLAFAESQGILEHFKSPIISRKDEQLLGSVKFLMLEAGVDDDLKICKTLFEAWTALYTIN
jgi:hypothetical protein